MQIGYFLSSEERGPQELVGIAVKAQQAGFDRLWISDHYQPCQIGSGQDAFFDAYRHHVLPQVQ